jgi:hypothetical protein
MRGWLCPATLKYFFDFPEALHVQITGLTAPPPTN